MTQADSFQLKWGVPLYWYLIMKRLLLLAILTFTNTTYAQSVWLEGVVDCGKWSSARKTNLAQYMEHILLGTINGMSLGAGIEIWAGTDGNKVSREQLYLWMDGWCQKNPLENILGGAWYFANERTKGAYEKRLNSK